MKQSIFKRILPLMMASVLLVFAGCGSTPVKNSVASSAQEQEPVAIAAEPAQDAASVDHSSLYAVDGATETSDNESYASDTANVNAVLVQNAGQLTMTSADINKVGDSAGDFSGGQNAAVAVLSGGTMALNGSNITTNALGAFGAIVSGEGSSLSLEDTSIYTSGDSSPALVVRDGAVASLSGGTLASEGTDSPSVLLAGGSVSLNGISLSALSGESLRVLSGTNELALNQTAMTATPIIEEGATLTLRLTNAASFTGELGGSTPAKVGVYLDETSKLVLNAETYVTFLVNADLMHANIESNGFNLYYDSNAPENTYLAGQSYMLPGGGFLAPII